MPERPISLDAAKLLHTARNRTDDDAVRGPEPESGFIAHVRKHPVLWGAAFALALSQIAVMVTT